MGFQPGTHSTVFCTLPERITKQKRLFTIAGVCIVLKKTGLHCVHFGLETTNLLTRAGSGQIQMSCGVAAEGDT